MALNPEPRDVSLQAERHGVTVNPSPERQAQALAFALDAARSLNGDKCEDVLVLDLRGKSQMTDYFVIATGTSDRQMRSAGMHVQELARERGLDGFRDNLREHQATWIVLDFVDVVVHLFESGTRQFYDLEMLWGDAERLTWARPGDTVLNSPRHERNRAGLTRDDVLPDS
ncbi:MAG: ribosome silencing factor [Phycisphaerales bacterium]|nr:ribosome silencing factor [Phycisphaerales bacterium]